MSTAPASFGGTADDDDLLLLNDDVNDNTVGWDDGLSGGMDSSAVLGSINGPAASATGGPGAQAPRAQAGPKRNPGLCWCFDVASYQPYFNVDTIDVLERAIEALKVWKNKEDGGGGTLGRC